MQSLTEVLFEYAATKRAELLLGTANGVDDDLPPEERPDRAEVLPGCLLKFQDQVEIYDEFTVMVVCPGRGWDWFYCISIDEEGRLNLGQQQATAVTDRIPRDPLETPMPVLPIEPEV